MAIQRWRQFDFSLGVQEATTWLLKKPNELARGINLRFTESVGGFQRRFGFQRAGSQFSGTQSPAGGHIAKYTTGSVRFVAVNNNAATATIIRTQNSTTGVWSDLAGISYPVNAVVFFLDYLDEVYISGFDPLTGDPLTPYNVDKTLNVSSTRNLVNCPPCYFFAEYLGLLYAANVKVGAMRYPDRVYKSSPPLGFATSIQGAQSDVLSMATLVDNVPTMTNFTTPAGTVAQSSEVNTANHGWQAFDDNPGPPNNPSASRWISATAANEWIQYDFGAGNAKVITYYSIVGEMQGETVGRGPKTWVLRGSNDGVTFTDIHTVTNAPTWNQNIGEKRTYATNNTTAYRYYRLFVNANQGADYISIQELELLSSLNGSRVINAKVDSARYLKPGMAVDIYKVGTNTKLYDLNIQAVDKLNNIISFAPLMQTLSTGAFNTTTDVITLTDATPFVTGTPVKFQTTTGLPAPLAADVTYYAIFVSSTTIKLATTVDNALLGNAIDITTVGSGTHYIRMSYQFGDNDEIWLDNRKGSLTMMWNTDYPVPEASDFLAIKPGTDSSNVISGIGKSSNRLFIWTKNSGTRWDGQNLVVFNNNIGCISHNSIANIDDDWIIWVDQNGNVRARSESGGQQENISRPVRNRYLRKLSLAQLKAVNAAVFNNVYKLYIGDPDGKTGLIRLCYDFESNTWSPERLGYPALFQSSDDFTGTLQPYFFSTNGYLYQDEIGNLDDDKVIAFEAGTGKDMFGTEQLKSYYGIMLFTKNCSGLKLEAVVDGGQMKTIGRIEGEQCWMKFPEQGDSVLEKGVAIDWQVMGANEGDPPAVEGAVVFYTPEENVPSERRLK